MKLGVFAVLFQDRALEETLDLVADLGIEAVDFGAGGYPGDAHCKPGLLLQDEEKFKKFEATVQEKKLTISALSCHGNPLHPDPTIAKPHHEAFRNTVLLAEKLDVERVVVFSGCPGGSQADETPNWVTCTWPGFTDIVEWQWKEKVIPYWKEQGGFASEHGVKVCFEMHPGFCVYNPETLLRLRDAVGPVIGANVDPSHFFWQGIDPVAAVYELRDAVYYVHAKDVKVNQLNSSTNGVLDTKSYTRKMERSWLFRTVGYGHGYEFWREFVSALRLVGYDHVLCIEHEDSLMSPREGLEKAVSFLRQVIITEQPGETWWT